MADLPQYLSSIPCLPPELWLNVFEHATDIPGAYTHRDSPAITAFTRDQHGISVHRRYREAADLMLVAIRVCKSWVPLAATCLFKYLLIKSGEHAVAISKTLQSPAILLPQNLSQYPIRLELALEGVHVWEAHHRKAFASIISICPNIRIFSNVFSSVSSAICGGSHFLGSMADIVIHLRPNVCRLELKGSCREIDIILHRLSSRLQVLWLLHDRSDCSAEQDFFLPITFPSLHTLILSDRGTSSAAPHSWTMPSLRSFYTRNAESMHAIHFFDAHARGLLYLGINHHSFGQLHLCSSLLELTIFSADLLNATSATLPPSIRVLKIIDDTTQPPSLTSMAVPRVTWHLRDFLQERQNLPSLKTLGFLLLLGWTRVRGSPHLKEWRNAFCSLETVCRHRGVRLEVSIGADQHSADVWRTMHPDILFQ